MNIYLKWNPSFLGVKEIVSLFDLEISQEENCFAKAQLVIDATTPLPPSGTEGLIQGESGEIFFKGILKAGPLKIEGNFAEIELIAKPTNFIEQNQDLQKESRVSPYWDELWVKSEKLNDFEEIQDVKTSSLYCDRCTGVLSRSDWFEGQKLLCLTQVFFPDSLKVRIIRSPLKACTILVHAHWVQYDSGLANLSASLRHAFPRSQISTYTQNSIIEKWPETGKRLRRSGLWIVKSKLKQMAPPSPFYPSYSPSVPLREEGDQLKSYRMKRYWFKPSLWVGWSYKQKRKETLSLTLLHEVHPMFLGEATVKNIEFTLQDINPDPGVYPWHPEYEYREGAKVAYNNAIYRCKKSHKSCLSFIENRDYWSFKKVFHTSLGNPARASFFLTERGYKAAEHAMERAKAFLAQSARCVEVSFEGPWEALKEVTTDMSITLSDSRLPGGEITGKVVKYTLSAKGETGVRIGCVTLLCSVGAGKVVTKTVKATPHYALDGYCEDLYQIHINKICQTPTGLCYFKYDDKRPPIRENEGSILKGIELINSPAEQEKEMLQYAYKSPAAIKKALAHKPTRIRMFFRDLRTKERIDHSIPVKMAASWASPKQWGR